MPADGPRPDRCDDRTLHQRLDPALSAVAAALEAEAAGLHDVKALPAVPGNRRKGGGAQGASRFMFFFPSKMSVEFF